MARTTSYNSEVGENALRLKKCETTSTLAGRLPEFCFLVAYETRYIFRYYLIHTELTRTKCNPDNSILLRGAEVEPPTKKKNAHYTASSHQGEEQNRKYLPNTHIRQLTSELVPSR